MTDIEYQPVEGRLEDVVERNCKLHDTQPCAEMAAGDRDSTNGLGAEFVGKLVQGVRRQPAKVRRINHLVKQWCCCHAEGHRLKVFTTLD